MYSKAITACAAFGVLLPVCGLRVQDSEDVLKVLTDSEFREDSHEQVKARSTESPRFMSYTFEPGLSGFAVNRFSGQVECVGLDGQAYNQSVKTGWYVHKIGGYYPYTERRLSEYSNGKTIYEVVFSEKKVQFNCVQLPTDWKDSKGRTCAKYASRDYCTDHGTEGRGWPTCGRWNVFCKNHDIHSYQNQEMDAFNACCECGGGWDPMGPTTSILTTTVTEEPVVTTTVVTTTSMSTQTMTESEETTRNVLATTPASTTDRQGSREGRAGHATTFSILAGLLVLLVSTVH